MFDFQYLYFLILLHDAHCINLPPLTAEHACAAIEVREQERGLWQWIRGSEAWAGWELAQPERNPRRQLIPMSQYHLWVQMEGEKLYCRLHTASMNFISLWWELVGQPLDMLGRLVRADTDEIYRKAVAQHCFQVQNAAWTPAETRFDKEHIKMRVLSDQDEAAWLAAAGSPVGNPRLNSCTVTDLCLQLNQHRSVRAHLLLIWAPTSDHQPGCACADPHPDLNFARTARQSVIARGAKQTSSPSSSLPASPAGDGSALPLSTGMHQHGPQLENACCE